ncbi:MAG: solute carrier organic anion transporter [Pseudomonadales bacterium]|nr:solute carrier organic anion transporter [Pseudomonadales bacterium]
MKLRKLLTFLLISVFGALPMSASAQTQPCTLTILRTTDENLHRFQLGVQCSPHKQRYRYYIDVEKSGRSGNTRSSQSGQVLIESGDMVVGDIKINIQAGDTVTVHARLEAHDTDIATVTEHYPAAS